MSSDTEKDATEVKRAQYIAGLRGLADALERAPEIALPDEGQAGYPIRFWFFDSSSAKAKMAQTVEAFNLKKLSKTGSDEDYFKVDAAIEGLHIRMIAPRRNVCTARVIGKKTVKRPVATGWEEKEIEVDDVVWDCPPLLAADESDEPFPHLANAEPQAGV